MQPNKPLFYGIVGLAIVAVIVMFIVSRFISAPITDLSSLQPTVNIEVVVAPAIKPWVDEAARAYNQANPKNQVKVTTAAGLVPNSSFQTTNTTPPAAWIADATFMVDLARTGQGLPFEAGQSVATTALAWGAYNSKLDDFRQDYGELNWQNIHTKGTNPNDALKLVIAAPQNSAEGIAALISATAGHLGKQALTSNDISAADSWLTETFGQRNTQTPATPAGDFATKGVSAGDVGVLTMASWQKGRLNTRNDFTLTPAQPGVTLDYSFAIWGESTPEVKEAAIAFRQFLLDSAQQNQLTAHNLNPAGSASDSVQADGVAVQRLLDWANRGLR